MRSKNERTGNVPFRAITREKITGRRIRAGTRTHALEMNCTRARAHNAYALEQVACVKNCGKIAF